MRGRIATFHEEKKYRSKINAGCAITGARPPDRFWGQLFVTIRCLFDSIELFAVKFLRFCLAVTKVFHIFVATKGYRYQLLS